MKTRNSINLLETRQPCHAFRVTDACQSLKRDHKKCGSYRCPFYKPEGCKDWVRIEDEDGINLIPPEEYVAARKAKAGEPKIPTWKVRWESA